MAPEMETDKNSISSDPNEFLAKIGDGRSIFECGKGHIIYAQGDPADSVYYLRKGKAKVTVVSARGKEAVVAMLTAGDFFGEGCIGRSGSASSARCPP